MRINVYAEEIIHEVALVEKIADTGRKFFGVRLFLASAPELHHEPGDDDRSAITFWVPWTKKLGHDPQALVALFGSAIRLLQDKVPYGLLPDGGDAPPVVRRMPR